MKDFNDQQLLAEYARNGSEAAFGELVQRHVNLVYGTALRIVRDPQLAEDLTQEVFLVLARKASTLVQHPTLCAWLHLTARNIAAKLIRTEVRRRGREEEVTAMHDSQNDHTPVPWNEIAPKLDDLLGKLSDPDREALLLRFFQNKSAREMAEMLSLSAEAAQKRVTRALARLRSLFAEEGVAIDDGGLENVMETHSKYAVPTGLASSITASVSAGANRRGEGVEIAIERSPWRIAAFAAGILALVGILIFMMAPRGWIDSVWPVVAGGQAWQGAQGRTIPRTLGEPASATELAAAVSMTVPVRQFPEIAWKQAGLGTPEDTLVTYMWAKKRGDIKTAIATATSRLDQELSALYFQNKTDEEVAKMMMESARKQNVFEILSKRQSGENTIILEVYFNDDAPGDFSILTFRKLGDDWRIAGVEERSGGSGEVTR